MTIAEEYGFPTDPATIDARAAQTEKIVRERIARASLFPRFCDLLGVALPSREPPSGSLLPFELGDAVEDLGFIPVTSIRWGFLPLPTVRTPNWIGPDGFTKFEAYHRRGETWFLTTMMSDGQAFCVGSGPSGNARTDWRPSVGVFEQDYRAQLEAVREYMDRTGAHPLYRPTAQDIAQVWRLFYVDGLTHGTAFVSLLLAWLPLIVLIMALITILDVALVPGGL